MRRLGWAVVAVWGILGVACISLPPSLAVPTVAAEEDQWLASVETLRDAWVESRQRELSDQEWRALCDRFVAVVETFPDPARLDALSASMSPKERSELEWRIGQVLSDLALSSRSSTRLTLNQLTRVLYASREWRVSSSWLGLSRERVRNGMLDEMRFKAREFPHLSEARLTVVRAALDWELGVEWDAPDRPDTYPVDAPSADASPDEIGRWVNGVRDATGASEYGVATTDEGRYDVGWAGLAVANLVLRGVHARLLERHAALLADDAGDLPEPELTVVLRQSLGVRECVVRPAGRADDVVEIRVAQWVRDACGSFAPERQVWIVSDL